MSGDGQQYSTVSVENVMVSEAIGLLEDLTRSDRSTEYEERLDILRNLRAAYRAAGTSDVIISSDLLGRVKFQVRMMRLHCLTIVGNCLQSMVLPCKTPRSLLELYASRCDCVIKAMTDLKHVGHGDSTE